MATSPDAASDQVSDAVGLEFVEFLIALHTIRRQMTPDDPDDDTTPDASDGLDQMLGQLIDTIGT